MEPAMEDWRRTASAAMGSNLTDTTMEVGARQAIEIARGHCALAAEVCRMFRQGLPYQHHAGDVAPNLSTVILRAKRAIIFTRRLSVSHAGSGHVFSLCGAHIGLQDTAPASWQRWEGHHAKAATHAATALQRLRSALSHVVAANGAVRVMLETAPAQVVSQHAATEMAVPVLFHNYREPTPPEGFTLWNAWGHAAEQLLRHVTQELAMARAAMEQMHPPVWAEFFEACSMLLPH